MSTGVTLKDYLTRWAREDTLRKAAVTILLTISQACREISALVAQGALAGELGASTGKTSGVDPQKKLDLIANDILVDHLKSAPVAAIASEELIEPLPLEIGAPVLVALDPIDGSSNIDANLSIGTIFSLLPAISRDGDPREFLQPGRHQIASGFLVYGPSTTLALTTGEGTQLYTLDRTSGEFILVHPDAVVPVATQEYAINTSNIRHWEEPLRMYIDDCNRGRDGPRGKNFNMRWTASPVADFYRILTRGGIFIYPGDLREGYAQGRLRLLYEASPIAFVLEQAGGAASSGTTRLLDIVPTTIHQHTPIIAGSRAEVEYVVRLLREPHTVAERSPLFGRRGLFRS
jgi:fructose-1,6-bisphosphatase I